MKKLVILLALFASFIIISCSENSTGPVNNNTDKSSSLYQFPYDYLTSFREIKLLDWNQPSTANSQDLVVRTAQSIEDIRDLYLMVFYKDPVQDTEGEGVLYFINQPGEKDLKLRLDDKLAVTDVKAFALNSSLETETDPPFEDAHRFRGVTSTWEIVNGQLVISALPWTTDVIEVFAYIQMPGSDQILYLQKPTDAGKIIIPGFQEGEIDNVHLFVNSNPFIDEP